MKHSARSALGVSSTITHSKPRVRLDLVACFSRLAAREVDAETESDIEMGTSMAS